MKNYIIIIVGIITVVLFGFLFYQSNQTQRTLIELYVRNQAIQEQSAKNLESVMNNTYHVYASTDSVIKQNHELLKRLDIIISSNVYPVSRNNIVYIRALVRNTIKQEVPIIVQKELNTFYLSTHKKP